MIRMLCVVRMRKDADPAQLDRVLNDDRIAAVFRGLRPMTEEEFMGYPTVANGASKSRETRDD